MARNSKNSSPSRSRSRDAKRKHYRRSSSGSESSVRRKHNSDEKKDKGYYPKASFSFKNKSDIKHHIVYENIKIRHKSDENEIMNNVKDLLEEELGPVEFITKTNTEEGSFSFSVGFKYDKDAMRFLRDNSTITTHDKIKLYGRPTLAFEQCLETFKELAK
jgi:hypothetical protein